jgi:hypothetical protein
MNIVFKAGIFLVAGVSGWGLLATAQKGTPVFTKAEQLTFSGKIKTTTSPYHRLDTALYPGLPPRVKELLTHSAGIAVCFTTNSSSITAKWCNTRAKQYPNLTPIANKGLDLYIKNTSGQWQYAGVGKPNGVCSESLLVENMNDNEKQCVLYLPLYDEISNLEIGVDAVASIAPLPDPFRKRILIYGSSIVQGASASRPGMAYPAQLGRQTGLAFLNLGLSGSAKMEKEAADMVASLEADAYILDCVPNTNPALIRERTGYLVTTIRAQHPGKPIIVLQSIVREQGAWDQKLGATVKQQNIAIQNEVLKLLEGGMKDLYFITSEQMLGNDHEGSVDGTHPNDLGFYRMTTRLLPLLQDILKKYGI